MRRQIRRVGAAVRRDPGFVALCAAAWLLLVLGRGAIRLFTMRRITSVLGEHLHETPRSALSDEATARGRRIRSAIRVVSPYTPTLSNCYPQALSAHVLLRLSRLPSTFYFGAAFGGDGMETHVWVRSGPVYVSGAPVHRDFATVATFAHVPRRSDVAAHPVDPSDLPR